MFVLLLKSILEKNGSTTRCLLISSAVILFAPGLHAGVYQRTRDGKTLVWNNFPSDDDVVTWSGKRDAKGYATGSGTLTWYKTEKAFQTGSLLPTKGPIVVVTSYSGKMVRGKLTGSAVNVEPDGRRVQLKFADGMKTNGRTTEPEPSTAQSHNERVAVANTAPAEGPGPSPAAKVPVKKTVAEKKTDQPAKESSTPAPAPPAPPAEEETQASNDTAAPAKMQPSSSLEQPTVEVASIRATPPPPPPPQSAEAEDSAKDRMIADFKDETRDVLAQVSEATDDFRSADRLDSVAKLPPPVSESVNSLVQRARDFRAKVGYQTAVRDFRAENQTVDALSALDQANRNIAAKDASAASAKLADFLNSNPEAAADNQKPLWQYLTSIQQLCSRAEKEANTHSQRADSFAAANRTTDAIREYQEAYRIFPNPATAEKIRQLQANSLGL